MIPDAPDPTPLRPLPPRASAVDACHEALRAALLRGDFAPGARLPPERTLAETFRVNRVTVRTALARLASARLLSVRQGSGYVVQDFRRTGGPELVPGLVALAREAVDARGIAADVLLVRRHLTRAVMERLAAHPPGAAALDAVEKRVDEFEALASSGGAHAAPERDEALAAADLAVVAALLDATGSAVLALCINPVASVLSAMPELRAAMYASPETNVQGYRAVLAGLRARNEQLPELAAGLLRERDEATLRRLARRARGAHKRGQ